MHAREAFFEEALRKAFPLFGEVFDDPVVSAGGPGEDVSPLQSFLSFAAPRWEKGMHARAAAEEWVTSYRAWSEQTPGGVMLANTAVCVPIEAWDDIEAAMRGFTEGPLT